MKKVKRWWERIKRMEMREWIAYGLSAAFLWMAVAWAWGISGGNVRFSGDAHHRDEIVTTERYMREVWGVMGEQPLAREPLGYQATPAFRLRPVVTGRDDGLPYVYVEMKAGGHVFMLTIPYDNVEWVPAAQGAGATINVVWGGEMPVILTRTGYSFGRFVTFQQPARWEIDRVATQYVAADAYYKLDMVTSARITLPADPAWQQLRSKNVG